MLPTELHGGYKRYKEDTLAFTTWLAEAAKQCGRGADVQEATSSSSSLGKRKKQKVSSKVPLSKFTSLATSISDAEIPIPSSIAIAAGRALSLRKRFLDFFTEKESRQDEGHAYFIRTMEKALSILQVTHAKSDADIQVKSKKNNIRNVCIDLYVEDPVKSVKPTIHHLESVDLSAYQSTFEYEDDLNKDLEMLLQVWCLFDDFEKIRQLLVQTWKDYDAGNVDLMSAAITTNSAFDIVREQIADLGRENPKLDGLAAPLLFYTMACALGGIDGKDEEQASDPFNFEVYEAVQFCLLDIIQLLDGFTRVLGSEFVPVYDGRYGWHDPSKDTASLPAREKYAQERALLMQVMPEFAYLADFNIPLPGQDELTRGLREVMRTKTVNLWVAFTARIFLDIHSAMHSKTLRGFQDLRLTGVRAQRTLKEYFAYHKDLGVPGWPKSNDTLLKAIDRDIEMFIVHDILLSAGKRNANKREADPDAYDKEEYALLKSHPLLCGVLMFNINLRMQEAGLLLMNAYGTGMYVAYLYDGIQREPIAPSLDWPDMDLLINIHGEDRIFIGGRPTSHEDAFKKLVLVMGVSADTFAAGKRNELAAKAAAGFKALEETNVISRLFRTRYCGSDGSLAATSQNIESMLEDLAKKRKCIKRADSKEKLTTDLSGACGLQAQWLKTHKLSPLQLLTALRERLVDEEPSLMLNYFELHRRNQELLGTIRIALHDKFVQYFGPAYLQRKGEVATIIPYLFLIATMSAKAFQDMGTSNPSQHGVGTGSKIIGRAGEIIKAWEKGNSDKAVKELNVFCKNKPNMEDIKLQTREEKAAYWFALDEVIDPATMASLMTGIGR